MFVREWCIAGCQLHMAYLKLEHVSFAVDKLVAPWRNWGRGTCCFRVACITVVGGGHARNAPAGKTSETVSKVTFMLSSKM